MDNSPIVAPTTQVKIISIHEITGKSKKLIFVIGLVVVIILITVVSLFMMYSKKPADNSTSDVELKTEYENPFDEKTQYENPFAEPTGYQNPFDF